MGNKMNSPEGRGDRGVKTREKEDGEERGQKEGERGKGRGEERHHKACFPHVHLQAHDLLPPPTV